MQKNLQFNLKRFEKLPEVRGWAVKTNGKRTVKQTTRIKFRFIFPL